MKNGINVLSLFDGMACGMIALEKAGIKVNKYYASEIKRHAIKVSRDNYPDIVQVGNVEFVARSMINNSIDLLIGGTPCQNLTIINQTDDRGLMGVKSRLFWEYIRVLKEIKPTYFFLENVASMKIKDRDIISKTLGVEPILINSNLVSAQDRRRLYWTNIPRVEQPEDMKIMLSDIIEYGSLREEKFSEKKAAFIEKKKGGTMYVRVDGDKSMPITARGYSAWNTQFVTDECGIRDLTINEYKKLQTIPLSYKMDIIKSKATDLIGDGWTIDVIAHIFKNIKLKTR